MKKLIVMYIMLFITFSVSVKAAKIENINFGNEPGVISVEGNSSTESAIVKIDNIDGIKHIEMLEDVEGDFSHTIRIKNPKGLYTVSLNDGQAGNIPDEKHIYLSDTLCASGIETDISSMGLIVGDKVNARALVKNIGNNSENISFYAAFYTNDGSLARVGSSTTNIAAGEEALVKFQFEADIFSDLEKVKIMLWNEEQKPISNNLKYNINYSLLYVSNTGTDKNEGSMDKPLATIKRALAKANIMRKKEGDVIAIILREGKYDIGNIVLDDDDAGTIISAYPGENVILNGATKLPSLAFQQVVETDDEYSRLLNSAKGNVYKLPLNGNSSGGVIPAIHYQGSFEPFDMVSVNGEHLNLARYPNSGYNSISSAISPSTIGYNSDRDSANMTFGYSGTRPSAWVNADDAWVIGYWVYGWAQDMGKISSINISKKQITTQGASTYGLTAAFPGGRYYAFNLLEELDSENEFYIDRSTNTIYLYSENGLSDSQIRLATNKQNMIDIKNTENIVINGITIEDVKGFGVRVENSKSVIIQNCTLHNIGLDAVRMNGENCGVKGCEIYDIGAGGVNITGGDRSTLTNSGNFVINCGIHDYALDYRVYMPGIRVTGSGSYIAHNEIYNAPHSAIIFTGNEHILEYNSIHDVLLETTDAGAIYCGQDMLGYGSVIRYNYFENIDAVKKPADGFCVAIYFDDLYSGGTAYGNVINNVDLAFLLGGGRNNTFSNNIIMNIPSDSDYAIFTDRRDSDWWGNMREGVIERMAQINYQNDIWRSKYPQSYNTLSDEPELPKYNTIKNNVIYPEGQCNIIDIITHYGTVENNTVIATNPGFIEEEEKDFTLRNDSVIFEVIPEFKNIPFKEIGRLQ